MIHKAWYVNCDRCHAPFEISTESARQARRIAEPEVKRVRGDNSGEMEDVCFDCMTPEEQERSGAQRPLRSRYR
jgi:hypothetical protein